MKHFLYHYDQKQVVCLPCRGVILTRSSIYFDNLYETHNFHLIHKMNNIDLFIIMISKQEIDRFTLPSALVLRVHVPT